MFSTGTILKRGESIALSVDSDVLKAELQKLIKENKIHMEEIKEEKKEEIKEEKKEEIKEEKKEEMGWWTQAVQTFGDLTNIGETLIKELEIKTETEKVIPKLVEKRWKIK